MPANIALVPLPPYSPELNPVEWLWEYMKERFRCGCTTTTTPSPTPLAVTSLCSHPWIMQVKP